MGAGEQDKSVMDNVIQAHIDPVGQHVREKEATGGAGDAGGSAAPALGAEGEQAGPSSSSPAKQDVGATPMHLRGGTGEDAKIRVGGNTAEVQVRAQADKGGPNPTPFDEVPAAPVLVAADDVVPPA